MALARKSLDMKRSVSMENKLDWIAYNTFRLIHVVSTRQTTLNFRKLSALYFAGTTTRLDAMSIYWMS